MKQKRFVALLLAVVMLCMLFSGCSLKPNVMIVDGTNIKEGTFAYYYSYCYYNYYETYGDSGVSYYTLMSVSQHVLVNRLFKEYGLKLSDTDREELENTRSAQIETLGGQAGYAAFLRTFNLNDAEYRSILEIAPKYRILRDYLFGEGGQYEASEDELRQLYHEQYARVLFIYISTKDIETVEDREAKYALAEEAYARALAGEDFSKLILEYGEDETQAADPYSGAYVQLGTLTDTELEEMLFSLGDYEISEIETTTDGYYIYQRLPFDEDFLDSIFANDEDVFSDYLDELLYYYLVDRMSEFEYEYYDRFYETDFTKGVSYWSYMAQDTSSAGVLAG